MFVHWSTLKWVGVLRCPHRLEEGEEVEYTLVKGLLVSQVPLGPNKGEQACRWQDMTLFEL